VPVSLALFRIGIAGAILFAVLVGIGPLWTTFTEPGGVFDDPDAQFHFRRMSRTIEAGRLLPPVFDEWENFPDGGRAVWPPLHDACLALLARAGGSSQADPRRGIPLAAALPVLQLLAVVALVAWIAYRRAGRRGALVAAWLAALSIALFRSASYGEVDHNGAEALGWALFAALGLEIGDRWDLRPASALLWAGLWGGTVLLGMGFFPGLVLGAVTIGGAVALADAAARRSRGRVAATLALGFGLAGAALHFFASLRVTPDPADPWRLGPPFVLALSVCAAGLALFSLADGFRLRSNGGWWSPLAVAGLAVAAVAAVAQRSPAWTGFARGFSFIGAQDPWLATIREFHPITASTSGLGLVAILPAASVALAVLMLVWTWRRRPLVPLALAATGIAFLATTLLAFAQARFSRDVVVLGALVGGLGWEALSRDRARLRLARVAVALSLLPTIGGLSYYLLRSIGRQDASRSIGLHGEVAREILARTPNPGSPPEWGILAPWDFGHAILWRTGRAVALNNFGNFHPGYQRKVRILLETSPAVAVSELESLRLRYIVTTNPMGRIVSMVESIGADSRPWRSSAPLPGRNRPLAFDSLLFRLHLRNGQPYPEDSLADRSALARFHKLWESPIAAPGGRIPRTMLFELRQGAP
jgi:hypothetical protein